MQSCDSIRKMTSDELLELIRSTRQELEPADIDLLQKFYFGWLDSELSEGIGRQERSNIYYTYTIIRDLLTGILLITDASTFNQEIKKGELK